MYIKGLIAEGEGQQLDFKFEISSALKIAKTLVAFANTDGGRLLIGVKDNGKIAGIRSEEEIYMAQLAAEQFTKPEVEIKIKDHEIEGKTILEVFVPPSEKKPHYAKEFKIENDGSKKEVWLPYIRRNDENLLANKVLTAVWEKQKENKPTAIIYKKPERQLLKYLSENNKITFTQFCRMSKIPPFVAHKILVNMVSVGLVEVHITPNENFFTLKDAA